MEPQPILLGQRVWRLGDQNAVADTVSLVKGDLIDPFCTWIC